MREYLADSLLTIVVYNEQATLVNNNWSEPSCHRHFREWTRMVLMPPEDAGLKRDMAQGDITISLMTGKEPQHEGGAVAVMDRPKTDSAIEPIEMSALVGVEFRETFVEIHELQPNRRLITTIEVLSPSNRRRDTPGWSQYVRKRQAHLEGNANLVEIDLLRGGARMEMLDEWPNSPYYLLVCRRAKAPVCTVWPSYYTRSLPEIPVPLNPPDADVPLSIQPLIDRFNHRSKYELDIDYHQPCRPMLEKDGTEWLTSRLLTS